MSERASGAVETREPGTGDLLKELEERFVLHWGEMASAWGINRTMGQIHGLLYVSPEPLSADEVMERLKISRGNASMLPSRISANGFSEFTTMTKSGSR